jgi:Predicted membrane protein
MGKRFIVYGLIGWCAEVFWTGLGSLMKGDVKLSAFTYIWMFPIYGLAVFLEYVHNKIRHMPVLLRGSIYMVIIFTIEYSTGSLLRLVLGVCPWDYSGSPLSINGIIRLDFIPVWFFAGLVFEKIHDTIDKIGVRLNLN